MTRTTLMRHAGTASRSRAERYVRWPRTDRHGAPAPWRDHIRQRCARCPCLRPRSLPRRNRRYGRRQAARSCRSTLTASTTLRAHRMRDAAVSGCSPYAKATSAAQPRTPPYLASACRIASSTSARDGRELAEMALVNRASARAARRGSVPAWRRARWTVDSLMDALFIKRGCIQNCSDGKKQSSDIRAELDTVARAVQESG